MLATAENSPAPVAEPKADADQPSAVGLSDASRRPAPAKELKPGLLRQLNQLFNRRERWQITILYFALVTRAGVEVVGVASIMPFMSVISHPEIVQENRWLASAYNAFGFTSTTDFLTVMGIGVVVMLVTVNVVGATAQYAIVRFSWGMNHRLSMRLMAGYLAQPYSFFTQRNSAGLSKSLLGEVQQVVNGVLTPVLDMGARLIVVVAIVTLLLVVDPMLALSVAAVLGGVYGVLYVLIRKKQRRLGRQRVTANRERFKIAGEAFGGIKDVKVLGREQAFLRAFRPASWAMSRATASNQTIAFLPRYLIETLAFGGIILVILFYLRGGRDMNSILPVVSLYAVAGYRLMPEIQRLFGAFASIRFNRAALDDFLADYHHLPEAKPETTEEPLPFEQTIEFENVTFTYPNAARPALDGVSLTIEKRQSIGLIGPSGSGKTTLVDLLLGLYTPDSGEIRIDGVPLTASNIRPWQRQLGYVPQHIYLTDDTVARNIAFGVPAASVDDQRVHDAARLAHIDDFVRTMPEEYDTVVGERGVRLSGGQRQRIGIARALHHDPDVLIMDEATSALDTGTETAVMDAVRDLSGHKTIVLIAHRLSTIESCDCVIRLEQGRVVDHGTLAALTLRPNGQEPATTTLNRTVRRSVMD